jgi:hypothetical protein
MAGAEFSGRHRSRVLVGGRVGRSCVKCCRCIAASTFADPVPRGSALGDELPLDAPDAQNGLPVARAAACDPILLCALTPRWRSLAHRWLVAVAAN